MPDPPHLAVELNTWQEIAGYLGVSVREAQYWEKNDGMPVHRMPGKKSRVKAYPAELDTWKLRVLASPGSSAAAPVNNHRLSTPRTFGTGRSSRVPRLSRRAALGIAGIAGAAAIGVARLFRRGAAVSRARVVGNALCAWDDAGRELWKHPFAKMLRDRTGVSGMLRDPGRQAQVTDLSGDGDRQVLFAAAFQQDAGGAPEDELYCFSSDGKLLWRYRPDITVTFGDARFSGPWYLGDLAIASGPRRKIIWLALEHWNWHPGAVLALDPEGHAAVKFVNAGHMYVLERASNGPKNYILAGGVNNEYACAAFAVLDEDAPPSSSPQTPGTRFECLGPRGQPARYFLLPPSEITAAIGRPYNVVALIQEVNQHLVVTTREVPGEDTGTGIYRFSKAIEPLDVAFDDNWAATHRRLQGEGKLDHRLRDCPQLTRPAAVRRWDPITGWTTLAVPPSKSVKPDAYQA